MKIELSVHGGSFERRVMLLLIYTTYVIRIAIGILPRLHHECGGKLGYSYLEVVTGTTITQQGFTSNLEDSVESST